jgi:hypothetical protein
VIENYHFQEEKEGGKLSLNRTQQPKVEHNEELNFYLL